MDVPAQFSGRTCPVVRTPTEIDLDGLRKHLLVGERRVAARSYLFRNGQPFHVLYLVATGCLKTCELAADGREQVTGFRTPGDLMGIGAIGLDQYTCDAVAIEGSSVWELPYPALLHACRYVPTLQLALAAAMANEIRQDGAWVSQVGIRSAEHRVGAFLLDLEGRIERVRSDRCDCTLRIRRADIASYLSLTRETVSRALVHLARLGYVTVRRREVQVRDGARLAAFVRAFSDTAPTAKVDSARDAPPLAVGKPCGCGG